MEEFSPDSSKINSAESHTSIINNNTENTKEQHKSLDSLDHQRYKRKKSDKKNHIPLATRETKIEEKNEFIFEKIKEFAIYFKEGNISQILRKKNPDKLYKVNRVLEIEKIKKKLFSKKI